MSGYFDAIYFMSMLNSHNLRHVIREQVAGAPIVRRLGLEPILMGYVIIAPGMKVGEVGEADIIPRNDIKSAVSYALAAEYLGMQTVYLEAGSGAPEPVPEDMIKAVKQELKIPSFHRRGYQGTGSGAKGEERWGRCNNNRDHSGEQQLLTPLGEHNQGDQGKMIITS